MTTAEKIDSLKEFIINTEDAMKDSPVNGIAGTIIQPHSVMRGWIEQAKDQIKQLEK